MRFTSPYRRYGVVLKPAKKVEIDGELVFKPGIHIQFENGQAVIDDPKVIDLLVKSKWYGKDFISPEYEAKKQKEKEAKIEDTQKKTASKENTDSGSDNRRGSSGNSRLSNRSNET
ncbi:MAG: hypothetical protein DRP85_07585 [Candidatus Makaraimicrobium thalassicum]|nr:MAG: hypothetical protein DRP85_07585 [Candidatus Omnitrophota bacterium]